MCSREINDRSYYVAVYVSLDEFKAYGPMTVVKLTPKSIYIYGEEVRQIKDHVECHVWSYLHDTHQEHPPKNDTDREARRRKFPGLDQEHQGEDYWHNHMANQVAMLPHTSWLNYGNYQIEVYKKHASLRIISIVTSHKWYVMVRITPVNTDDQMLQILADAQGVDSEAESQNNQDSDTEKDIRITWNDGVIKDYSK